MADPVTEPLGRSVQARRLVREIDMGTVAEPDWKVLRGTVSSSGDIEGTFVDDSDYDSGAWSAQTKNELAWSDECTVRLAPDRTTGEYDEVHEFLRSLALQVGIDAEVRYRVSEVHTGPRTLAYQGIASVHVKEEKGDKNALSRLVVQFMGVGELTQIEHPYPHPVAP